MAAQLYNTANRAFEDAPTPQIYDAAAGAYKDSTGLVHDEQAGAWVERWGAFVQNMPESIATGKTSGGSTGSVSSEKLDISKYHTLTGSWKMTWLENSQYYPNYQQGYGQIIADDAVLFNTGNCTYSTQTSQVSSNQVIVHYKNGIFSLDISKYKSLSIRTVVTKSFSNWYHYFTVEDLVWT